MKNSLHCPCLLKINENFITEPIDPLITYSKRNLGTLQEGLANPQEAIRAHEKEAHIRAHGADSARAPS